MKIVVVGAGGIGTHLIAQLVGQLERRDVLTVIDGDHFEAKNLDRQLFPESEIGRNKAEVMSGMYNIECSPEYIESANDFELFEPDLIFCVPDNVKARVLAVDYCMKNDCSCIVAGNERTSANALYYHKDLYTEFDEALHPLEHFGYNTKPEATKERAVISCAEARQSAPQTIVANNMAATFAMALFLFWRDETEGMTHEFKLEFAPVEFDWVASKVSTKTIIGL